MAGLNEATYDITAERSLLGVTMLAPEYCRDAFLSVRHDDWFHREARAAAAVITAMLVSGRSVDPESVLVEAMSRGLVPAKLDGDFLVKCAQVASQPESAPFFAQRIRDLSAARKLWQVGTRAAQRMESAWETGVDSVDVRAAVSELRRACDDAEEIVAELSAPPTPMGEFLDHEDDRSWLIPGLLERSERIVLTGAEGGGKALAIDTPIPTPKGWTTMGALSIGDEVFHADGRPVRVIAATEVMHDRPCYRITFSDGAEIVADEQHLWLTDTLLSREADAKARRRGPLKLRGADQSHKRRHFAAVRTTRQIADSLSARDGHSLNHAIRVSQPLQYPAQELPINPYALGAWLGDGTSRGAGFTCADPEIVDEIRKAGEAVRAGVERYAFRISSGDRSEAKVTTFQGRLRALGLIQNKHIPMRYLHGSVDQRLALLQGLMDTDGSIFGTVGSGRGKGVKCEFSVTSERLCRDVLELVLGLGIKAVLRESAAKLNGIEISRRYRLQFITDLPVFRLPRKLELLAAPPTERSRFRYIEKVEAIESVPVRCIQVDRADGLFVAGRECVVTHNSVLCSQLATCMAGGLHPFTAAPLGVGNRGIRVLIVDCENSAPQSRRRFRWMVHLVDAARAKHGLSPMDWSESMFIDTRPAGIDLLSAKDTSWLEHAITQTAPDLLVLGPLYKLHHLNPNDETAARELVWVLDSLRERHGFALLTEAHAGNGTDSSGDRMMRPLGSSLFRRWPEFGFGLRRAKADTSKGRAELVDVVSWRGSREERQWPSSLHHSHVLPWTPADPDYYEQLRQVA